MEQDFYEDYGEAESGSPTTGVFAIRNSKSVSILDDEPGPGWSTLSFTDESDPIGLNSQMFYVPTALLDAAIKKRQDVAKSK